MPWPSGFVIPLVLVRTSWFEWVDGDHLTLERNEDYWDKDNMPYYKQIVYSFISDMPARASALESGTVDVAYNLASSQIDELKSASIGLDRQPLQPERCYASDFQHA